MPFLFADFIIGTLTNREIGVSFPDIQQTIRNFLGALPSANKHLAAWDSMNAAVERIEKISKRSRNPLKDLGKELSSQSSECRALAAGEIAKLGSDEAGPLVRKALADEDGYVRSCAREGIGTAVNTQTATPSFCSEVFDGVAAALVHEKHDRIDCLNVIEVLPELDRTRAVAALSSPDILRIDHPELSTLLRRLTNLGHKLDKSVIDWIPVLQPRLTGPGAGRDGHAYAELLRAAALAGDTRLDGWIEDALQVHREASGWSIEEAAAEAKCIALGLSPTLRADMEAWKEEAGFDNLPVPVQHFLAVLDLDAIWEGCGLAQYLQTEMTIQAALQGLESMGDERHAWVLEKALQMCGPKGIPSDEMERYELFGANNGQLEDEINGIESPVQPSSGNMRMLAYFYAAENASAFVR